MGWAARGPRTYLCHVTLNLSCGQLSLTASSKPVHLDWLGRSFRQLDCLEKGTVQCPALVREGWEHSPWTSALELAALVLGSLLDSRCPFLLMPCLLLC